MTYSQDQYFFNILPVRLCECTLEVVNMGFKLFRETLSYSHGDGIYSRKSRRMTRTAMVSIRGLSSNQRKWG